MNISLIGMPASGKSTAGVILAKHLGYDFVDTDLLIQAKEGKKLKDIIAFYGRDGMLEVENQVIKNLKCKNSVIATGGSAVYSPEAMNRLREISKIVYLQVDFDDISARLSDLRARGVVFKEGQTLENLYLERKQLYEKYADYIVSEEGLTLDQTVEEILKLFE